MRSAREQKADAKRTGAASKVLAKIALPDRCVLAEGSRCQSEAEPRAGLWYGQPAYSRTAVL
jgi:hypothetical protein